MPRYPETHWETTAGNATRPPEVRSNDFGRQNEHKSIKAMIGIAVLLVISVLLYEFNFKPARIHASPTPAISHHFASSSH